METRREKGSQTLTVPIQPDNCKKVPASKRKRGLPQSKDCWALIPLSADPVRPFRIKSGGLASSPWTNSFGGGMRSIGEKMTAKVMADFNPINQGLHSFAIWLENICGLTLGN